MGTARSQNQFPPLPCWRSRGQQAEGHQITAESKETEDRAPSPALDPRYGAQMLLLSEKTSPAARCFQESCEASHLRGKKMTPKHCNSGVIPHCRASHHKTMGLSLPCNRRRVLRSPGRQVHPWTGTFSSTARMQKAGRRHQPFALQSLCALG